MKNLKVIFIVAVTIMSFTILPSCVRDRTPKLSENKKTVEKYMSAFRKKDHAKILSCLGASRCVFS